MGNHVIQYPKEYSMCLGCRTCEIVCALAHEGQMSPSFARIHVDKGTLKWPIHYVRTCQHCDEAFCYNACPKKDAAMRRDENGIVYVVEEACIGCGKCVKACPEEASRIHVTKVGGKRVAKKCDLCRGREGGPACVAFCPSLCLGMSDDPMPELEKEVG